MSISKSVQETNCLSLYFKFSLKLTKKKDQNPIQVLLTTTLQIDEFKLLKKEGGQSFTKERVALFLTFTVEMNIVFL